VVKIDINRLSRRRCTADTCGTYFAGEPAEDVRLLSERTHEADDAGHQKPPGRAGPISVIGAGHRVLRPSGSTTGVVRDFTGHGIGQSFHTPSRPCWHYDEPPGDGA